MSLRSSRSLASSACNSTLRASGIGAGGGIVEVRSADSNNVEIGGTPGCAERLESRRPSRLNAGGGVRECRRETSRGRRGRPALRPCTEGRLRMGDRATAVGSILIASLTATFSSGSRQILQHACQPYSGCCQRPATDFLRVTSAILKASLTASPWPLRELKTGWNDGDGSRDRTWSEDWMIREGSGELLMVC